MTLKGSIGAESEVVAGEWRLEPGTGEGRRGGRGRTCGKFVRAEKSSFLGTVS